jgi:hypothetical protein
LSEYVAACGYLPTPEQLITDRDLLTTLDEINGQEVDCYIDAVAMHSDNRHAYFVHFIHNLLTYMHKIKLNPRIANVATIAVDSDSRLRRPPGQLEGAHWAKLIGLKKYSQGTTSESKLTRIYFGGSFHRFPLAWLFLCMYVRKHFPSIDVVGEIEDYYTGKSPPISL